MQQGKNIFFFSVCSAVKMQSDLFDLQSTFQASMQSGSTGLPVATAWAGKELPLPTNICVSGLWRPVPHARLLLLLSDSDTHLFLSTLFLSFSSSLSLFSSVCPDPFTSAEAGDDSMPNLNPFLSKLVVDATHLPVVSSDGVSFSSRTSGHEMFGGNNSFLFLLKSLVALVHLSVVTYKHDQFACLLCCCSLNVDFYKCLNCLLFSAWVIHLIVVHTKLKLCFFCLFFCENTS